MVSHSLKHENNTFVIDFNLLEEQLKDASILLLCSPHNPTGRVWTKEEMEKMVGICKKYDVSIISDEIHMDILIKRSIAFAFVKIL